MFPDASTALAERHGGTSIVDETLTQHDYRPPPPRWIPWAPIFPTLSRSAPPSSRLAPYSAQCCARGIAFHGPSALHGFSARSSVLLRPKKKEAATTQCSIYNAWRWRRNLRCRHVGAFSSGDRRRGRSWFSPASTEEGSSMVGSGVAALGGHAWPQRPRWQIGANKIWWRPHSMRSNRPPTCSAMMVGGQR
jgi:hypothetical protein